MSEFCSNFTVRIAISEVTAILTAISQVAAIFIDKLQYIAIFYWSNNIAIIFNKYIFPRVSVEMLYQKVHQIHNSGVWKQQLQLHTGNSRSESLSVINIMISRGMTG